MSAARYRQALRILERWPTDPSKGDSRDIGVLLRQRIGTAFKKGELSEISEPEKCDKMLASLENICSDKYRRQYSVTPELRVGALFLDFEGCHYSVSEEGFQHLKEREEEGTLKRTYKKIFGSKEDEDDEKKVAT